MSKERLKDLDARLIEEIELGVDGADAPEGSRKDLLVIMIYPCGELKPLFSRGKNVLLLTKTILYTL